VVKRSSDANGVSEKLAIQGPFFTVSADKGYHFEIRNPEKIISSDQSSKTSVRKLKRRKCANVTVDM